MAKGKKFGLGIIVGAVAGVLTGILTAPKSGKETRQDIKNKAGEIKGSAERKLKSAHKELDKLVGEAKRKAGELQGRAKEEMDDYAKKADDLKERVKTAITSVKSGDSDNDDVTIDNLMKDFADLKDKITGKAKNLKK